MDKKITFSIAGIVLALAVFVAAQVLWGGYGGPLGITVTPAVPNHYWKNCEIDGTVNANYTIINYNTQETWLKYRAWVTFNYPDNSTCRASIHAQTVQYERIGQETHAEAGERVLKQSLKDNWRTEYDRHYTREPELNISGSYSQ